MISIRNSRGYVLIEVLISAAIVAMVLATSIGSFYNISRSLVRAENMDVQIREARNIAARIRSGVEQPQDIDKNWLITMEPLKNPKQLVRYNIKHKQDISFGFSVDVFSRKLP